MSDGRKNTAPCHFFIDLKEVKSDGHFCNCIEILFHFALYTVVVIMSFWLF